MPYSYQEKVEALKQTQEYINNLPYTPTIPYPYCCVCFEKLTADNILEDENGLINVCIDCKDK